MSKRRQRGDAREGSRHIHPHLLKVSSTRSLSRVHPRPSQRGAWSCRETPSRPRLPCAGKRRHRIEPLTRVRHHHQARFVPRERLRLCHGCQLQAIAHDGGSEGRSRGEIHQRADFLWDHDSTSPIHGNDRILTGLMHATRHGSVGGISQAMKIGTYPGHPLGGRGSTEGDQGPTALVEFTPEGIPQGP